MTHLVDPEDLLSLINQIYDISSSQDLLSLLHRSLKDPLRLGPAAALIPFDDERRHYLLDGFVSLPSDSAPEDSSLPPPWIESWLVYYSKLDPIAHTIIGETLPRVLRYSDVLSPEEHLSSAFYREFLAKIPVAWVLALPLFSFGRYRGMIWLTRGDGEPDFDKTDRELSGTVAHHAAIAHQMLEWRRSPPLDSELGIVIINEENQIIFKNEEGAALLHELGVTWALGKGQGSVNIDFLHSDHGMFKIRTLLLRRPKGHSGGIDAYSRAVLTEPYPPRLSPPKRMEELDLSRRQSQIVLEIMAGRTNKEIAEKLSVTPQTVKDHLHAIFRHLGVRNRSELILKVLGGSPPFSEAP